MLTQRQLELFKIHLEKDHFLDLWAVSKQAGCDWEAVLDLLTSDEEFRGLVRRRYERLRQQLMDMQYRAATGKQKRGSINHAAIQSLLKKIEEEAYLPVFRPRKVERQKMDNGVTERLHGARKKPELLVVEPKSRPEPKVRSQFDDGDSE